MLFSVEQAFVRRDEKRAPRKTPAWEARIIKVEVSVEDNSLFPKLAVGS